MRRGIQSQSRVQSRRGLLEQLKHALDAEAFVRDILGAKNVHVEGSEIIHSCPLPWGLHKGGDENPSASFNSEYLVGNCFLCGGGDIFWYVQNVLEISYQEALDKLAEYLTPRELSTTDLLSEFESLWEEEDTVFTMPKYSPRLIQPWTRPTKYLTGRGISHESQIEFKTGIDLNNRDPLGNDKFVEQPRITIPVFFKGNLVGWIKRKYSDEQLGAKYRNSPQFPRSNILYNYDKDRDEVIVVESALSVIRLKSLGIEGVVATLGTKITEEQLRLLRTHSKITFFMDNDPPGIKAEEYLRRSLREFSTCWSIVNTVPGTDPDDFTREEIDEMLNSKEFVL